MTISDWPSMERPREKLLAQGPSALSNAELLALFIGTGTRGCSAVDVARNALAHAGGLRVLFDLPPDRLADIAGIGPARAALIKGAIEIATRYLEEGLQKREIFNSPEDTCHYLHARLRSRPHEVFACLFMDNRHRMIAYEEMFRGTINGTSVHPREIVKRALELNAAALIVAHNHPSGVAEPSETDRNMTRKLAASLALVDLRLLDHIVVGDGDVVSFSQQGLL